jgi:Spy/CpxP family protein refolding chaperone
MLALFGGTQMKQRGMIAAVLAVTLLAGAAASVTAQPPAGEPGQRMGRGPGGGGMGGPGRLGFPGLRQLDLTEAQREQVRNIHQSHREEGRQIAERTRAAQRELNLASEGTVVNESDIRTKANALAAAIADGTIHRAKVNAEIYNVLTAEQQQKLRELRTQMQERMKNRAQQRQQRRGQQQPQQ